MTWLVTLLLIICPSLYKARADNLIGPNSSCSVYSVFRTKPPPDPLTRPNHFGRGEVWLAPRLSYNTHHCKIFTLIGPHQLINKCVLCIYAPWLFLFTNTYPALKQVHLWSPQKPSPPSATHSSSQLPMTGTNYKKKMKLESLIPLHALKKRLSEQLTVH